MVVHDADSFPLTLEPDHRLDKVGPRLAINPGGPHNVVGGKSPLDGALAGELGPSIDAAGIGVLILGIWAIGPPGEDVISRYLYQAGADVCTRAGEILRSPCVDAVSLVLIALGCVDGGVGPRIHDDIGIEAGECVVDGSPVGDVKLCATQAEDLVGGVVLQKL